MKTEETEKEAHEEAGRFLLVVCGGILICFLIIIIFLFLEAMK